MEIEKEKVVDSQNIAMNTNKNKAFTELNQIQPEINRENQIFDSFLKSLNPDIYIPIQPWDKVRDMHLIFDNSYSDFYDDSNERLNFYEDDEVDVEKTLCSTEKKYG